MPGEKNGMMFHEQLKELASHQMDSKKKKKKKNNEINLELLDSMLAMLIAIRKGM